jgi:hypothetical protein
MTVTIGVDPHKSTHAAVAIDRDEQPLARVQVVADRCQTQRLLAWAEPLGTPRTWAVESAEGLGKLVAQQLLAAGEHVVDVPPTLAARVRLLGSRPRRRQEPRRARRCSSCTVSARSSPGSSWATSATRPGSRPQPASRPTTAPPPSKPPAGPAAVTGSTRGNRKLNHALHLAAVTQVRHDTPGRAYYQRKIAEGKSKKEALRVLKRRISDAVWRQLQVDLGRH